MAGPKGNAARRQLDPRAPVLRWEQEAIAVYLDFEFSFEIVAGKGVVRSR